MSKLRKALAMAAVVAVSLPLVAFSAGAAPPPSTGRATLPGSKPSWATPDHEVHGFAPLASTQRVRVYLAPRGGQAALNAAVQAVSTPGNPSYQRFLTTAQYAARFRPVSAEVDSVTSWLTNAGLQVTGVASGNRYVAASGTAGAVQKAFGVTVAQYDHNGKVEQAPTSDLSVPSDVSGSVLGVNGLSSPQQVHRAVAPPSPGFVNARPCSAYHGQISATYQADYKTPLPAFKGTRPSYAVCGYVPAQYRAAYGVDQSGLTGKGSTVAITDAYASPTILADANTYAGQHGEARFRKNQFSQSAPATFTHEDECDASGWYGEETLDVEAVHGIAPAANVRYYGAASCYDTDLLDTLQTVVDENQASIVTNSWGEPSQYETSGSVAAFEQVFRQGALQGIGFLFSSGDAGDDVGSTGLKQTDYPTSDPYVTSVGGTSDAIGADGAMVFQTGWGTDKYLLKPNGMAWSANNPLFTYGAGGGFSNLFNRPSYQDGVVPAASPAGRAVPDIAMDADPTTGMLVGQTQAFPDGARYGEYRIGGTSLASPLMAGMQALASQSAGGRLGFANPAIYRLARSGAAAFDDVLPGPRNAADVRPDYVNGVDASAGIAYSVRTFGDDSSLTTARGWDEVTGVGSPNAAYLASFNR